MDRTFGAKILEFFSLWIVLILWFFILRIPGPGYLVAITRTRPFLLIILGCEQTFSSMRPFVKVQKDRFTRREIGHQRFAVGRLENRERGLGEGAR